MAAENKNDLSIQSQDLESARADSNSPRAQIEKVLTGPRGKWAFLAAVAFVELIVALAIVLPITLTRKTSAPTAPTSAPTFMRPAPTETIPAGIDLESSSPITWNQTGRTLSGYAVCGDSAGSCVGLALSSDGQVLIATVPVRKETTDDTANNLNKFPSHIQAYSIDNVNKSWVAKGSPISLFNYYSYRPTIKTVVSSDGNVVAINQPGLVRVFRFDENTNTWNQMGSDIYGSYDEPNDGLTRTPLAMSSDGSIIAVGNPAENQVKVFRYDGAWTQLGQTLSALYYGNLFGSSIALSENGGVLAVLAKGIRSKGYMKVYSFESDGWEEKLIYSTEYHSWRQTGNSSGLYLGNLALSGDGSIAAISLQNYLGLTHGIKVFNLNNNPSISTSTWDWEEVDVNLAVGYDFPVELAFSSDGSVLAATSSQKVTVFGYNSTVQGWESITSLAIKTTENSYISLALSKDATTIATGYTRNSPYAPAIQVLRAQQA